MKKKKTFTPEEAIEQLRTETLDELMVRLSLVNRSIKLVIEEKDPYNVLDKYKGEAKRINQVIGEKRRELAGGIKPETVVVKLKTGRMNGKVLPMGK
jgi:hypothetical protein